MQYGHQAFEKREFLKALHHFQEATNYHKTTGEGFDSEIKVEDLEAYLAMVSSPPKKR